VTGQERAHAWDIPKVATAVTGNFGARACTDVYATWCVRVGDDTPFIVVTETKFRDRFARFLRLKGTFVSSALRAHTPPARTHTSERLLKVNVRAILVRISRAGQLSLKHSCLPKVATAVTGQERAHACDSNDRVRNFGARACTDICATWCVRVGTALHVRVYWDG
jgi:hypothetical protein